MLGKPWSCSGLYGMPSSVIGTFQLFNEPQLMRTLAPTVIGTAWTPNLYAYNIAFVNQLALLCERMDLDV